MGERRLNILRISRQVLVSTLLRIGHGKPEPGPPFTTNLPPDVEHRGVSYNLSTDCFELLIEHPSFEPVMDGCPIPWFQLEVSEVKPTNMCSVTAMPTTSLTGGRRGIPVFKDLLVPLEFADMTDRVFKRLAERMTPEPLWSMSKYEPVKPIAHFEPEPDPDPDAPHIVTGEA